MNDRVQHPTITWLYETATQIRNDLGRFYRDADKDRVRFNFGETPTTYTFKIKFTPSHRVLKFIVPKDNDIQSFECQLFVKTNNIIRDIDQIYSMHTQEYFSSDPEHDRLLLISLWLWGCFVNPERRHDVYKAQVQWIDVSDKRNDMLYVAIITKIGIVAKNQDIHATEHAGRTLFNEIFDPVVKLQVELTTPAGSCTRFLDVPEGMVKNIYAGQLYILNWMEHFSIMRFTPAKHHLSFTPAQYGFISDYLSKEFKDGYKNRKEG